MHEDNAMLLRWEIDDGGEPFLRPLPTPIPKPQGVTFMAPDDILPTAFLGGTKLTTEAEKENTMNTELNIETRRRPFSPHVVTLLVLVVVLLALGGSSVQAQTATDTTATTDTTASKPPADPNVAESSITLLAKGTVNDPSGAITVNGSVIVTAKRVIDSTSTTTPPVVVYDLDFSGLKGSSGTKTTLKTYVTGDNHASEIRPLQASDTIIVSCPYYDSTKDPLTARTMLITATLNFDVSTGKVTSGSISIGNNVVTSSTVGTFAPM